MEILEKIAYLKGLDAVSDDLSDVESYIYESEEDDDDDDDDDCCCCGDDDCDCDCDCDEEDECYETVCPVCEEHIFFDESILEDGFVLCTNCGEKLEFDLSEIEDVCYDDCDCEK